MFFFKRKKLAEIEEKLDRVLELLENQEQEANKRENGNRQFLCELLEKKTELLLNENKKQIEIMKAVLQDTESRLSGVAGQNMEEFAELRMALDKHDEAVKKALKSIRWDMEKEQEREKETAEKLELAENEIRMLLLNSVMDQLP